MLLRAALTAAALVPATAHAEMAEYRIDPEHAVIAFLVGHVGYADVLGRFTDFEGTVMFDPAARELGQVEITVNPASVDSQNDARDGHVRGGDFLDVDNHPVIRFTADGGTAETETEGTVEGMLEILGESRPLTLDITLNKIAEYPFGHMQETIGISARGTVTRSAYGMTYAIDNGLVGDEVDLIIEAEFIRQ